MLVERIRRLRPGATDRVACYACRVTTQELMQAVLALPKADLEELRDAIDERLAPIEGSPEFIAELERRSRLPGVPLDEAMARLRAR